MQNWTLEALRTLEARFDSMQFLFHVLPSESNVARYVFFVFHFFIFLYLFSGQNCNLLRIRIMPRM